ncbi:MAG: hydroxyacid dehydrogenase [Hyphomicrobium sp.]|nr:hydroxyacid dehydrogenase [Hyphomicrobium sp.]PPC79898.1 MAG: hydroxyacid dehydrogenase [Hyphomicrobium sp.]
MRIVVTNQIFPETHKLLSANAEVIGNSEPEPWSPELVRDKCRDAEAVMAFMPDRIDAPFIAACPNLKVIGAALKGYDNIDVTAAERAGVWVTIVPDLLTVPTAELAIGLMLGLGRHVLAGDRRIRAEGYHGWRPTLYGTGLDGARVGIVGFGRVGQAIAERLLGFRCHISACDMRPNSIPAHLAKAVDAIALNDLLAQSDYVVLALPLTETTHHIIGTGALARMKPSALLVNPARGSLVDERAVADALDAGRIAGYAADVFECEDWARTDRPSGIDARLTAPGAPTLFTPHIGSAVVDVRRKIELSAARSIIEALAGREPTGAVNNPGLPRTC